VTTISQWHAAIETNVPARTLWLRQTRSTNGESEGLSSNTMNTWLPRRVPERYPDAILWHPARRRKAGGRTIGRGGSHGQWG
jgi:hypothetical protein